MDRQVAIDGQFVSEKVSRVVEAIREYSPELEVKWIPPGARGDAAAYQIWHNPPGHEPYVMFTVRKDEDFDERVLFRIIHNDQRNGKVQMSEWEAWEKSQKLIKEQEFLDTMEEMMDKTAHIVKSPKNTYVVDKDLTIKDGIPFNANKLKD